MGRLKRKEAVFFIVRVGHVSIWLMQKVVQIGFMFGNRYK
ncbi:hypothetical protein EJK55_1317 [Moraxella catarrhalis]|uniref:Uncharacterized protein n=1 Tax=Moraxella catarrhalis TaxID=480 RepID=A0A3S9QDF9_MORCA|nr:hypothetical protein MCR_1034 [Moraxella catarrhalis BBH18]AZQ86819.1 hypothetical protein EJK52_1084 [Moraxella catarrhalis]EKF83641.1 hypothetical protein MCRH_1109 [Moraxella catarrhalis RH4]AZQ89877.1 hypothetical protein EJK50_1137 [Moraxella catarrhalis]AZQ91272.1 hypothetical protein EJK51_1082 [Moraxella catarrhalis]